MIKTPYSLYDDRLINNAHSSVSQEQKELRLCVIAHFIATSLLYKHTEFQ